MVWVLLAAGRRGSNVCSMGHVSKSMVGTFCLGRRPVFAFICWLHSRQVTRPFSGVFLPPFDQGMMWSGSALLGRSVMS